MTSDRSGRPTWPHCAVLLAADGGARLARPERVLTVDGDSLLPRMVRLLAATAPRRLLAIVGTGELAAQLAAAGAEILVHDAWPSGFAASVQLAAKALRGHDGPTLFASVDQSRLEARHLDALLSAGRDLAVGAGRDIASRHDADSFGLPALISAETLALADRLTGDEDFGPIWRTQPERVALVDAPELGFDLASPPRPVTAIRHRRIDSRRRRAEGEQERAPGVRELKQKRIRKTLIDTAMRLFAERGFEAVTVDEIAAAAGISRRSLFRYFPTKGDIVFAWTEIMTDSLRETFALHAAAPHAADDPAETVLRRAFVTALSHIRTDTAQTVALVRLIEQSPALRQHSLRKYEAWEDSIMTAWHDRLPPGPTQFLTARVLARGAIAAFRSALDEWLRQEGRLPFPDLLDEAFRIQHDIFDLRLLSRPVARSCPDDEPPPGNP
ncbi:TetR family transcriptional regulator [Acidomonas methanolica]|nr:TetR family transcriptional regulator [Acidomonas methanolica]